MIQKSAIVVLGAHRSGTSAMTRTLAFTGLVLPRRLLVAQPDNPLGFWESQAITELNDEILAARDTCWQELFPSEEAPPLSNSMALFLERAERLLRSEFYDSPDIVLKDPRICHLVSFWRKALTQSGYHAAYTIMVRNPDEVSRSLARRSGASLDRGLLMWLANMLSAERATRGRKRLFVVYDDLLRDPRAVLDDVEMMLGRPLPRRTAITELEVERWLDERLRSHRSDGEVRRRGELHALVQDAHDWFVQAARGEAPQTLVIDAVAERLKLHQQVIAGVLADYKGEIRTARTELELTRQRAGELATQLEDLTRSEASSRIESLDLAEQLRAERASSDDRLDELAKTSTALHEALLQLQSSRDELSLISTQQCAALDASWHEVALLRSAFDAVAGELRLEQTKALACLEEADAERRRLQAQEDELGLRDEDLATLSDVLTAVRDQAKMLQQRLEQQRSDEQSFLDRLGSILEIDPLIQHDSWTQSLGTLQPINDAIDLQAARAALLDAVENAVIRAHGAEADLATAQAASRVQSLRAEAERAEAAEALQTCITQATAQARQARLEGGRLALEAEAARAQATHDAEQARTAYSRILLQSTNLLRERDELTSEREGLLKRLEEETEKVSMLNGRSEAVTVSLTYIQSRPWWRILSFFKSMVRLRAACY